MFDKQYIILGLKIVLHLITRLIMYHITRGILYGPYNIIVTCIIRGKIVCNFFISNFVADKIKSRISKNVKSLQTKAELSFGLYFRPHIPSKNTFWNDDSRFIEHTTDSSVTYRPAEWKNNTSFDIQVVQVILRYGVGPSAFWWEMIFFRTIHQKFAQAQK